MCVHMYQKPCYILYLSACGNLFIVLFEYQVVFCMFFFSFIRLNLFSLNVLFVFKIVTPETGIVNYNKL